ncbi:MULTISPECIES: phosphoribosylformimino-5-aminoimidazole carboxamide ribotide isomerase [unclassified Fibrobacter]|uniref:phosphoribosylformimino-5-aminoimidazole carboxamide ribotide isomerase n=1 Tax=unclassified Fibrobacter TaxID=2634177 RepID=UPI000D6B2960|nr:MULTISPECIES: phosphoribosylformimino-5-aminoimidazole carboxamide ribotide isomerase [unclassified Fibrobacter]PWJ69136.1 1-(5-phosphoribosyl)-5-[(5-phosphoribosylamino)methylideneamino] imidazole-4-carboxamide isomerase [Fibrobacter sp. UWR4]PZW72967.1 1-(5-phosphoribosyl)-5-[(5-phosphoribosylamino)methylideneamino] imidazole-4-carboxamide isomerase [Fibrobacter sp. UWR1]
MTKFRPCIDLHDGKVKQIVGSSLSDSGAGLKTNFETDRSPAWFAELYKKDHIKGGHVIMLGKGNVEAAKTALAAYPGGLQVGGGITADNAKEYLDAGASHVIVTSWIFPEGKLDMERLNRLVSTVGKDRLVLDLSCKRTGVDANGKPQWSIAINRWQTLIDIQITSETLNELARYCDEFLVHAADVEGKQQGMDDDLIRFLAKESPIPVTYAGGAKSLADLQHCKEISGGKIDLTIGSALDLFGGNGVKYDECVKFNEGT